MKAEELWGSACKILQEEMTRISYSTWIETALKPCALVGDTVLLECVSPWCSRWAPAVTWARFKRRSAPRRDVP